MKSVQLPGNHVRAESNSVVRLAGPFIPLALAASLSLWALAPAARATDGYQLIGIGQYEIGMAGAVVADPGDPMTAITNPAGLAFIPPQAAFSAEWFNPTRSSNFGFGQVGSHSNLYGIPSVGWSAPAFGPNLYFGGGMFATSGMGVNYLQPNTPMGTVQVYSDIQYFSMTPALAWKPTPNWSVGLGVNISLEQMSMQQTFNGVGINLASPSTAFGAGVSLGVLHKINKYVTVGLMYRTPTFFTPLTWQETTENFNGVQGNAGQYSTTLNYPQQIALGAAFHPTGRWTISLEGQWINWSSTLNTLTLHGPWVGTNQVVMRTHWHDEWVFNIGTQYQLTKWLAIRGGYSYGTNPIGSSDTASNLLLPAVVQNTITVGATQTLGMGWSLTEAYMHAFSNTINGGPLAPGLAATSATLAENSFGFQIGYRF